ncbi:molybdenum cofactor sulfurase domain-containing protein [Cavenderia fasciculata]|uniref:Molybdenum cofactor sulfurase domain-containing protein n=1 Tax=Cavenderia fasciculata TaxID=261658 RepID=F4PXZ4_CACFS|nr:molybdenum cofactor sulfurase domain-containing protein [Cavenderia fasciculata]EGG19654.1 molybdenum cofactor sulfurase domain-containing protein [Cavenderia fasciculata]|eukprot:XP_004357948.1 molybdenum cofactor sulfurase domain-containing protein [Cavenderia fasciculata]
MSSVQSSNTALLLALPLAIATLSAFYYYKKYYAPQSSKKSNSDSIIRVGKIIIYPIKSCQGIEVKRANIDKYGIINDRRWMLHHEGRFMSQRTTPKMANIGVAFNADETELIVRMEGMEDLVVPVLDENRLVIDSAVWKDDVKALDCGDTAGEWFTRALGKDGIRLLQVPPPSVYHRRVSTQWTKKLIVEDHNKEHVANPQQVTDQEYDQFQQAFVDSSQVMMLSQASIDDLNIHITETRKKNKEEQKPNLTHKRFRPNLLLVGTDAYEEDSYDIVRVGGMIFRKVNRVARCKLTTVADEKGVLDPYGDNEPLRTLGSYRKIGNGLFLGTHFVHDDPDQGELCVGDRVDVIRSSKPWVELDK